MCRRPRDPERASRSATAYSRKQNDAHSVCSACSGIKDFGAWVLVSMVNCEFDAAQACIERLVDARLLEDGGKDVTGMALAIVRFFAIRGHWQDREDTTLLMQQAAGRHRDRFGEALAPYYLGILNEPRGQFDEALNHLLSATATFQQLNDRRAKAHALAGLAVVYGERRHWREAITACEQAAPIPGIPKLGPLG
jgi:tetratricopeptide (TPR) repeat protein